MMKIFAGIGRAVLTLLAEIGRLSGFTARALASCVSPPIYGRLIGQQIMRVGYYSLPVVGLTAFFTGGALALQIYLGGNRYRLMFEPFADQVEIPRQNRGPALDTLMARYAQRVEHYIHVAPYNWFNFYDFWQDARDDVEPAAVVGEHIGV